MPGQRVSLSGRLGNLTGMQAVVTLWIGQLVSLAGTGMTRFAMTIWVWQQTERATAVALIWVAAIAPAVVLDQEVSGKIQPRDVVQTLKRWSAHDDDTGRAEGNR